MPPQVDKVFPLGNLLDSFGTATSEQRRAIYIAGGTAFVSLALVGFSALDLAKGRPFQAALSFTVAVTFALIAAWAPTRAEPDVAIRFALFLSLSVITYETFIGANGGFTFLWFYVLPIGMFFLLGQREGALWFSASALILAWLLFVVDHRETPGGAVGTIALATFTLLGILGFGLERARFRLSQVLEQEKIALEKGLADLEALYGLVPICASCKSVRDDRGYWHDIEIYLSKHSAVELQAAFCPSCKQDGQAPPKGERQPLSSVTSRAERADPQLEHARRRRIYFHLGLGVLIPFLGYFGVVDLLAGRWFEAALIFGLVLLLTACLLVMRVKQVDRAVYQTAAGASMLVMAFDLHLGAYDGYSVLWLYSFPAFTIFVLGARGLAWSLAIFLLSAFNLLLPIGYLYPTAMSSRFLTTYVLVTAMAYGLEATRRRAHERLIQESEALRETLDQVRTLRGLLPMCPSCKKVRDVRGLWQQIEAHVTRISGLNSPTAYARAAADGPWTRWVCP